MLELAEEVFKVELGFFNLSCEAFSFLFVDILLRFFNEGDDVTHAEDTLSHPGGVEGLEVVHFLAGTDQFDRSAGDGLHGEGSTTAGVAIELGEDDTGEGNGFVEMLGNVDGFLAEGGVGYEEDFVGLDNFLKVFDFVDEVFIDLETACGIENESIDVLFFGPFEGSLTDFRDVLVRALGENGEPFLLSKHFELVDRGGAIDVTGDEGGLVAFFLERVGEFDGGSGFTGAVEADHHYAEGLGVVELGGTFAEHGDEVVVDNLNDLLTWGDGFYDILAEAVFFDTCDEVPSDFKMNISGEQGGVDLLEGVRHVVFS